MTNDRTVRLVKRPMSLDNTFGMVVLSVSTASWPRWVKVGARGGDPRLAFGIKDRKVMMGNPNGMMATHITNKVTDVIFGSFFGKHLS